MNNAHQEAIKQFMSLMENVDDRMKGTFQNMHHGYPAETLVRFLKARNWNVQKGHKMLIDCLHWRIQNEIDNILAKPIIPTDLYGAVRDSQLVGLSGYSKEGLPIIAIGVGLSTFDKASVNHYVRSHIQMNEYRDRVVLPTATEKSGRHISSCLKVLDMTGLKLSVLNQRKTVKPLLQERTKGKIQVLQGCGRDELLKIMDYSSLPHFCRKEGSGSSRHSSNGTIDNCFSLDHTFHQQFYNYLKQQATLIETGLRIKQGSIHVDFPEPDPQDTKIAETIECEFHRLADQNGLCNSLNGLKVNRD
ncbi:phosphatidylinositol/phosphatidylcholine transfer protein SFH11-like isoform X3 [Durio zibethinus]|uniref:Phosphatidylinositol/phosphatidylcholine transfer protein SFH11-like isoform X3 n=1 Tax=Durio zibethinus TaxID=66656 RepID=A0A6P5ZJP7_DURZI|nr:phosphatidylinositol/phosphatidylcholine transfer protein SFH11-like isoform X3 [Durio zibethinus]